MTKMPFFICPNNYHHRIVEKENNFSFQILFEDEIHHEIENLTRNEAIKILVSKCIKHEMGN